MSGSERGRSLDVCEILRFSPLGALTMSLLSKIKKILKKKGLFSVVHSENTHRRF